jgi:hypothetical protein
MSKKIMSIIAIVALGIMAFGAISSGAWFTNTAISNQNDTKMGTLVVNIVDGREGSTPGLHIANAEPGVAGAPFTLGIDNLGSLPLKAVVTAPFETGNGDLYNLLWVTVEKQTDINSFAPVYNGWLKDMSFSIPNMPVKATPDWYQFYKITVTPAQSIDNSLQGAGTYFRFVVNASQLIAP